MSNGATRTLATRCATVTEALEEEAPDVAVTLADPFWMATTRPVGFTVATVASLVAQLTGAPVIARPFWSRTVAVSCSVSPREWKVTDEREMVIVVGTERWGWGGGGTVAAGGEEQGAE